MPNIATNFLICITRICEDVLHIIQLVSWISHLKESCRKLKCYGITTLKVNHKQFIFFLLPHVLLTGTHSCTPWITSNNSYVNTILNVVITYLTLTVKPWTIISEILVYCRQNYFSRSSRFGIYIAKIVF